MPRECRRLKRQEQGRNKNDFKGNKHILHSTFVIFSLFLMYPIFNIIIKFPYNAHSYWLKQRALPENIERVDDGKLAFKFLLRNFDKFDPN